MLPSIRTLETKTQILRRPFQFSVNEVFRMKAEHFSFKGAMSPNAHARANENKLEKDGPTFSSCVGDFGRLFLSV